MASLCDGEVLFYGMDPASPVMVRHRQQGGRAVFIRAPHIVLANAEHELLLTNIDGRPLGQQGQCGDHVSHLLAAIAVAWALGIGTDLIRAGIDAFGLEGMESALESA